MKTIILGPPGTGKTTTLLDLVDQFLQQGIRPKQIGYFSFTKKAAKEAASRAADKFNLDIDTDLENFRTLHSLAFNELGMSKEKMMKPEDYKEFGQKCGLPIKTAKYSEEDGTFNSDNEYLTIINTARVKRMDLLEYYDSRKNIIDIERSTLFLLSEQLQKFKKEKGLKDFTDLLEDYISLEKNPNFKVLFIDEAQDLSLIQWEMVRTLWVNAEKTYIAGDDDQAIFKWAGADVDHFIALKEEVDNIKTLDQSYRIPGGPIHELSQKIIGKVQNRFDKQYKPREEIGILKRYSDITQVNMKEGEWLVLSSANYFLDDAKDLCELQGWYYQCKGINSVSLKLLLALNNWEHWRKGSQLNTIEIKNIYEYLGSNVVDGFRKGKTLHSDAKYKLKECQEQHGLNIDKVWYDSFEGLDNITENYIRNMRANGEMINKNPRIKMSTIHGAKGGEADKVLLLQDITGAAIETFSHDPDELHRLFYTGATRAKRELHIVDPKKFDRAYIL
ncbi:MAG: UvrD-helicase domain-containing protein [Alphaproteobacteria bacterium]|jgi:DNA helicase-2/ATP-dependent DNA helicase PcrA